ncbi:laccase domain-containing protein [Salmonella enterica subsp. enterica]|nr:laccase domain-containing protein [Salmonella enterica subsp. enterica]
MHSKRADASYGNTPRTVCAVMTANCLPVLFCNREGNRSGGGSCGLARIMKGVLEETVAC